MKLIIIEGVDRTGKNTLINYLCSKTSNYIVRHFGKPQGSTNEERTDHQKNDFNKEFLFANRRNKYKRAENDLLIWNRSHIGEHVYGTMYREYNPAWIWNLEEIYDFDKDYEIYLILLYADPEFVIKQDDGNSFSTKLEDRKKEIDLFHEAMNLSKIRNKLTICVNDGNSYIPIDEIRKEVIEFLNM